MSGDVSYVCGVDTYVVEVTCFARGISVGCARHSTQHGFVVGFNVEGCSFHHVLEVTHREVGC